jgi:EAL domain-containing protein (putative c-di-GMP-specific phosphodiesterase class I)/FixJ family two-component response regulator
MTEQGGRTDGLRFLVVEDHGFQRWTLGLMLQNLGARAVFSAQDGVEALEVLRHIDPPIDVVITDLNMPRMDGIEFIRHAADLAVPAAFIVASEQDRALVASVARMASAYGVHVLDAMQKPVTAVKLRGALQSYRRSERRTGAAAAMPTFTLEQIEAGIAAGQFEPFFQPEAEIATGIVRGAEALARWRHPEYGLLPPSAFIDPLEESGRIDALTLNIFEQAAGCCREWRKAGIDVSLSVNISLVSLTEVALADRLITLATAAELHPRDITLEVTETAAATHIGRVLENLSRLRMKGFGLSIDDFGTGYASMQQLARMPFTQLKIDQSFIRNSPTDPTSLAVLESSLEIAAKLGIEAVAEGVETREELQLLRQLGCRVAQGFFFGRPLPAQDFLSSLR